MNITLLHDYFLNSSGVVTDSRKISKDCFFVALRGDKFDGNAFAKTALENGAKYAMIDRPELAKADPRFLWVENTLESLQKLALFHRNKLKTKIIAITGSNGKTTTKELIFNVLSQKFNTKATQGNLNNHIGVPLTLLQLSSKTEIGIVEMGANHRKEIAFLCDIAQPDYGLITNFGKAHLEGFGSEQGVIAGKSELYEHIHATESLLFLNLDDPIQKKWSQYRYNCTFGESGDAQYCIEYLKKKKGFLELKWNGKTIKSQLMGAYNYPNLAAAIAVGGFFGLDFEQISQGIASYLPTNNRSQILDKGSKRIRLDAYNANPSSMKAAITSFVEEVKTRGAIILGDMFELGNYSAAAHQEIVALVESTELEKIILVGEQFAKTQSKDPRIQTFTSLERVKNFLVDQPFQQTEILIKGSRGMTLEVLLDVL